MEHANLSASPCSDFDQVLRGLEPDASVLEDRHGVCVCQIFTVGVSEITCQSFVCTLRESVILGLGLPSLRAGSVSIPHSVDK